jgi:hypothetical protein
MTRRAAAYTQADLTRAIKAARAAGAAAVELPGGIVIRLDAPPPVAAPSIETAEASCDSAFGGPA